MNHPENISTNHQTFKQFLFHNQRNRVILLLAAVAIIIQFAFFKYLYPFASYIHGDSFSYLGAAQNNLTINTYLVGYSKFLRIFNTFAKPDFILVAFQYLLIQSSVLFLLFTIFFFYKPGRIVQIILLCFMIFNPLFLHLGNMVSSDGFFLALSSIWFALLLWIIHRPSMKIIIWQGVVLFIGFTTRYNALIYPFIAGIAFWLSNLPLRKKIIGVGLGLTLCGLFVGFTMLQYKKLTGYWQYSPFSGWQFANNAMYAYRSVDSADRRPVPEKFQALDKRIRNFYYKTRNKAKFPSEQAEASTFYMWSRGMPLMDYRDSLFKKTKDSLAELKKWASMGPFYKEYGIYIIRKYPWHFLKYFMWPNSRKYYAPPIEFLAEYNGGKDQVNETAKKWFGYTSRKVKVRMGDKKVWILDSYPILSGIVNVIMLFGLLYYILLKGWRLNSIFNKTIIMAGTVWLINAGFTIFASSAALRFQSFPIILTTTFALLLVDWMAQLVRSMQSEAKNNQSKSIISVESNPMNKEQALA
jgi:hypothetical protein